MSEVAPPHEQRTVNFYGDEVTAVRIDDTVFVPIRPICELLGVSWPAQTRKLNSDPVLSDAKMSVAIRQQTSTAGSTRPKTSKMLSLPLDYLNGWLFGINANRVSDDIRPALIRYQRECHRVLFAAFSTGVAVRGDDDELQAIIDNDADLSEVDNIGRALIAMARNQAQIKMAVTDHENRLQLIEATLGDPARQITGEQASNVSQAVKTVAGELSQRSGRNEYGGVYGELYRRFGVASYKDLPAGKYEEAMTFLRGWYQQLTDSDGVVF